MDKQTALALFDELKQFTIEALAIVAPKCPATTDKTRPWDPAGEGGPIGMICHFTGGPDGVASTRWGNENPQNKGSSWHMMVFDHKLSILNDLLKKYKLVNEHFKVTVFFVATLDESTWHGNWTNRYTFGVENRNLGRLRQKGSDSWYRNKYRYKHADRKGPPWGVGDTWWEPYTRGQIAANIIVGQALRAIQGDLFVPEWVLPHSAIWSMKSDTGCAFPMYMVRAGIFGKSSPYQQSWLQSYPGEYDLDWDPNTDPIDLSILDPFRGDLDHIPDEEPDPKLLKDEENDWLGILPWTRWAFHQLGYHIVDQGQTAGSMLTLDHYTRHAAKTFQRSTHDPRWTYGTLKVDGVPGPKTIKGIMKQLDRFAVKYASPL